MILCGKEGYENKKENITFKLWNFKNNKVEEHFIVNTKELGFIGFIHSGHLLKDNKLVLYANLLIEQIEDPCIPKFFLYSLENKKLINSGYVGNPDKNADDCGECCIYSFLTQRNNCSVLSLLGKKNNENMIVFDPLKAKIIFA